MFQEEDEVEASVREVNRLLGELPVHPGAMATTDSPVTMDMKAVLNVEHRLVLL